jgi:hypothetical protein
VCAPRGWSFIHSSRWTPLDEYNKPVPSNSLTLSPTAPRRHTSASTQPSPPLARGQQSPAAWQ